MDELTVECFLYADDRVILESSVCGLQEKSTYWVDGSATWSKLGSPPAIGDPGRKERLSIGLLVKQRTNERI
ncbi:hypothetical protein EVAR_28440_1 [Eumeta japonica]|uniref:Uncharacterized protein n=1 Tax=Eumeta variegata TaxID=151549 RepID=A0A4C1VBI7_EUMVA|nr:hypothetical protein EVAR_28440_1 [Eumeta japonica]